MRYIVTTLRGLETVVADLLREKFDAQVESFERYAGLLRVTVDADQREVLDAAYEIDHSRASKSTNRSTPRKKSELGNPINLDYPDKVIQVEIIDNWCCISYDFIRTPKCRMRF